ncbi:MAG: hypothetical protein NVS9B10_15180 [Nevskia sp.]
MTFQPPLRRIAVTASLSSAALLFAGIAQAIGFDIQRPNQQDFHAVAQDLTAGLDYKALGSAAPGGLLGFSLGAFGSYAPTRDSGAWKRLTGTSVDGVGVVGLRAGKGLPLGFDVGGFYTRVPGSDAAVWGGELRYAILDGGVATPAVALRGSYTRASNTGNFDYSSYGTDLSVSKGFLLATPYAGVGYVHSSTKADARFGLDPEGLDRAKYFAGLSFKLLLLDGTAEYERLGRSNVYSLKAGLTF